MDALIADLRHGLRLLRRSPGFTSVAVVTLALGIGANTAIFSMVDAVVLRALPYADPDRLVMVWEESRLADFPKNTPAPANFADWRRMNRSFADMAATRGVSASLTGAGEPEQVLGRAVTPSFFPVLGVQPIIGRVVTENDDRSGAPVVVISDALWQRRFGGDAAALGRTILLNDSPYEIIGVMPRSFVFRNREIDYWTPISFSPDVAAVRTSHFLTVVARLKPGVAAEAAAADMRIVASALEKQFPDSNAGIGTVVIPIRDDLLGDARVELLILMAAAAAVLLIACANLAGLLLSRAAGRRGELAVRAALGATRGRLIRQLIVEATVLSLAGGVVGLALAPAGIAILERLTPIGLPSTTSSIDSRLLAFTCVVSIATGLLFSVLPALQAARASVHDALQQHTRGAVGGRGRWTRDALVVLQVAAALVLLVAAGLMLRTLANLRAIELGFQPDRLLTMRTTPPRPRYADPVTRLAFYDRVIAGLRAVPGVEHAAYSSMLPFLSPGNTMAFGIDALPRPRALAWDALYRVATNDYLVTLGVRLADGRLIDDRDGASAPKVVVINETMVHQFLPNQSPLGRQLWLGDPNGPRRTIVGVVKDVRERGHELALKAGVYVPAAQVPAALPEYLVLRVNGDPMAFVSEARRVIADVDSSQPISAVRTMDDIIDSSVADRHQQMVLLAAFASLALLLATVGLYGVLAYAVTQRSREIGLRIALGATGRAVVGLIVRRGLALTTAGLAIGAGAAWGVTRTMNNLLYGVGTTDPWTFAAVVALLGTVALVACVLPAMRASRVDPSVVLRSS
jgi:putative ABC transport system permease protein